MNTDFMASHVFLKEDLRTLDNTRSNDEESSLEVLLCQVVEQCLGWGYCQNNIPCNTLRLRTHYRGRGRRRNWRGQKKVSKLVTAIT